MTRARQVSVQDKVERCRSDSALLVIGLKLRQLQAMSVRGEIPGAAKLGRTWTYDVGKLRRWVREREEAATCQAISIGGATSGGHESRFDGAMSDEAYEHLLS